MRISAETPAHIEKHVGKTASRLLDVFMAGALRGMHQKS
jgi:hypothetical protein